jgi:methanogenic corrinoid protein MtbC1
MEDSIIRDQASGRRIRPSAHLWSDDMTDDREVDRLLELALRGDRANLRVFLDEVIDHSADHPRHVLSDVIAPALGSLEAVSREDRATAAAIAIMLGSMRLATARVIERLADWAASPNEVGRRIVIFSGSGGFEMLQAEIMAAELECDGHEVRFGGGGVPSDEILTSVGTWSPDVLLLFASCPTDIPGIRELIDTIRTIDACPGLQIAVGGGVFARAPGLAEEIGADLWATDDPDLRASILDDPARRAIPEQRTVGQGKRASRAA